MRLYPDGMFSVEAVLNPSRGTPKHMGAFDVTRNDVDPTEPKENPEGVVVFYLKARTPLGEAQWGDVTVLREEFGGPHEHIDKHKAKLPDGRTVSLNMNFSASEYTMEVVELAYEYIYGAKTKTTQGELIETNLEIFQKEYVEAAKRSPRRSPQQLALEAIRNISFGRVRVARGFTRFEFVNLPPGTKMIDGILVPEKVVVIVRKGR